MNIETPNHPPEPVASVEAWERRNQQDYFTKHFPESAGYRGADHRLFNV